MNGASRFPRLGRILAWLERWWPVSLAACLVLCELLSWAALKLALRKTSVDIFHEVACGNFKTNRKPQMLVLGSSPAMVEANQGRPFPVLLKARLQDAYDVQSMPMVWADSAVLAQEAENIVANCGWDLRYIIVYAGHQDYVNASSLAMPRAMHPRRLALDADRIATPLLRRSHALRLLALTVARLRGRRSAPARAGEPAPDPSSYDLDAVLQTYRRNLERIQRAAQRAHAQLVLVTLSLNARMLPKQRFYERQNRVLRELARRPGTRLVDFQAQIGRRIRSGEYSGRNDCEPYESRPGTGRCWDPYHMGVLGHELLADLLERVLRTPEGGTVERQR
ncbi:MAG: hypothetical protein PHF00_05090 [Elusimicrobia bacterium]|nr:hypothetical protein [Elusimicrobiota bacterium]